MIIMKDIVKRTVVLLVVAVLVFAFVLTTAVSVFAYQEAAQSVQQVNESTNPSVQVTADGFEFEVLSDLTAKIVGYTGTETELILPAFVNETTPVTAIESGAFKDKTAIVSVSLSDSIVSVGDRAFEGCEALVSVELGKSLTTLGSEAFLGCDGLVAITVAAGNNSFSSYNGVLFSRDGKTLILYPQGDSRNSYSVPNNVTKIGDGAFAHSVNLTLVMLPSSLKEVGSRAFLGCESLSELILPSSVEKIGSYAFSSLKKLQTISLPDSVTEISEAAFSECSSLVTVNFGKNTKKIGTDAFSYCTALKELTLPESVVEVSQGAFLKCKALSQVTLPKGLVKIPQNTFSTCTNLKIVNYSGTEAEFIALSLDTQNAMVVYNFTYGKEQNSSSAPNKSEVSSSKSEVNSEKAESRVESENEESVSSRPSSISASSKPADFKTEDTNDDGYDLKLFQNSFLSLKANKSTFPKNIEISAEELFEGVAYVRVKAAIKELVTRFKVYDINAQLKGVSVEPNGKMLAEFKIPEDYNHKRIVVYHISKNAAADEVECKINRKNGTVKVEISRLGTYAVAEKPKPKITAAGISLIVAVILAAVLLPVYFVKQKKKS